MSLEVIGKELIDTEIHIIKEATCPSLSAKSTLTYRIGSTPDSQILVHLRANSGNGIFSNEWVRLDSIIEALNICKKSFSWDVLCPLFEKQSVNTAGFLMAALKHEELVRPLEHRYELLNTEEFMAELKKPITMNSNPHKSSKISTTKKRGPR